MGTGSTLPQVAIPYDFRLNYGALSGIAHHTIGLTWIADSPFGRGKKYLNRGVGGAAYDRHRDQAEAEGCELLCKAPAGKPLSPKR